MKNEKNIYTTSILIRKIWKTRNWKSSKIIIIKLFLKLEIIGSKLKEIRNSILIFIHQSYIFSYCVAQRVSIFLFTHKLSLINLLTVDEIHRVGTKIKTLYYKESIRITSILLTFQILVRNFFFKSHQITSWSKLS